MTSQRVMDKKVRRETKSSGVNVVIYTLWFSVIYYSTHKRENVIYMLYPIKIHMVYRRMGAWKKKNKSADVDLTPSVRVSFNRSQSTTNENAHRSHAIV